MGETFSITRRLRFQLRAYHIIGTAQAGQKTTRLVQFQKKRKFLLPKIIFVEYPSQQEFTCSNILKDGS